MRKVQVGDSFIILMAVLLLTDADGIAFLFLLAAFMHEMGHYAALRLCGGQVVSIRLTAAGAVMRYRIKSSAALRGIIALAGPVTSLFVALAAAKLDSYIFAGANFLLGIFNLLPVIPLDGSTVLESLFACMGRAESLTSQVVSLAGSILLFICSLWYFGAGQGAGLLFISVLLVLYQKNLQIFSQSGTIKYNSR